MPHRTSNKNYISHGLSNERSDLIVHMLHQVLSITYISCCFNQQTSVMCLVEIKESDYSRHIVCEIYS